METLETSRVCRLCGKQSGISINIFDKNENHVKKITAVLPIMVHEMDLLPKHMCHRCSYKLEEFHKFYVECLRMDAHLKSKLSWMRKEGGTKERPGVPMVHIENVKIKTEPLDYDVYELEPIMGGVDYINTMRSMQFPVDMVNTASMHEGVPYTTYARCRCYCDKGRSEHAAIAKDYESTRCNETDEPTNTNCKTAPNACDLNVLRSLRSEKESFHSRDPHRDLTTGRLIVSNDMVECARTSTTRTITRNVSSSSPLTSNVNSNSMKVEEEPCETRIDENADARSLRPRKVTVDYSISKRRARPSTSPAKALGSDLRVNLANEVLSEVRPVGEMKTEKSDSLVEGRVLRPRNKLGNSQNEVIVSRTQLVNDREQIIPKTCATDNGQADSKPQRANYKEGRIEHSRMMIKKEVLNIGCMFSNESDVSATRQPQNAAILHLTRVKSRTNALRNNVDVENNMDESCKSVPSSNARLCSFEVVQPLGQIAKNSPNKREKSSKSVRPVCYSPKYLRSQDSHLRSGKIKKLEHTNSLVKKFRRVPRRIDLNAQVRKQAGNNLLKLSNEKRKNVDVSTSTKLVVRDIKYYCEKCNTPFANQELYKLHGCYV